MYVKITRNQESGMGWHMPPGHVDVEERLIEESGEAEELFYIAWEEDGFSREIVAIDDVSEYDINLNAEDYFSDELLTVLEGIILDAESMCPEEITAKNIKMFIESKGKTWIDSLT